MCIRDSLFEGKLLREAAHPGARNGAQEFPLDEDRLHLFGNFVRHRVERPVEVYGVVGVVVDVKILPADLPPFLDPRGRHLRHLHVVRQIVGEPVHESLHQLAFVKAYRALFDEVYQHPPRVGGAEESAVRIPEFEASQREEVSERFGVCPYRDVPALLGRCV